MGVLYYSIGSRAALGPRVAAPSAAPPDFRVIFGSPSWP
jgi:hypothetical protein